MHLTDKAAVMPGPTRVRYQVLAAGCGLALLTYIHRQSFVRAVPEIQKTLKLDAEQAGYLAFTFLMAYGIFQVPCGLLGDRLGARHLLTILVLGWSLLTAATAAVAFLPAGVVWTLFALIGVRFLFGAFQAGGFPVWARVVADWVPPPQRASAQGAVWMFSRLGGFLGPFLFFWLFRYFETWSTPLVILGALGLAWCAVFWPWFRNRPDEMKQVNDAERRLIAGRDLATASDSNVMTRADQPEPIPWPQMLRSVNVYALCLMYGFVGAAGNFTTNMLPVYLDKNRQLTPEMTTLLSALPLALGMISCATGGLLSDWIIRRWGNRKWGRRCNGGLGLILAGLANLAVPSAEPTWLLALLLSLAFFCNDLNMGPAWAACADIGGRYAGTISGAMNMTGQFLGALGMVFAGIMLERGEVQTMFIVFTCCYGLAALCWLAVDVTKPLLEAR
jgi:ACS family glucarate transporter-like MFS transporter